MTLPVELRSLSKTICAAYSENNEKRNIASTIKHKTIRNEVNLRTKLEPTSKRKD